jgi:hypothetical protein
MNLKAISNEICHLVEQMDKLSSTIIIPQNDEFLSISSVAMGNLSSSPHGATNQPDKHPKGKHASVNQFDPQILGSAFPRNSPGIP